jgi:hypothetical protein
MGPSSRAALGRSSEASRFVEGQHRHAERFVLVVEGEYRDERVFVQHRFATYSADGKFAGFTFKLYCPNRIDSKRTPKLIVTTVDDHIKITKPVIIKFCSAANMFKMEFSAHAINHKFTEDFGADEDVKSDDEGFQVRPFASALPPSAAVATCLRRNKRVHRAYVCVVGVRCHGSMPTVRTVTVTVTP